LSQASAGYAVTSTRAGYAARSAGFPAITITCKGRLDYTPGHHQRSDRLACADLAHAVIRLRLDAHAFGRDAQASRDRLTHRGEVRAQSGRLRNDRRVDRDDGVARLTDLRSDLTQQLLAVRASETRIVAREMRSEIAEVRRSEDRVHDRVKEDVTIGVANEPRRVLDRDTA